MKKILTLCCLFLWQTALWANAVGYLKGRIIDDLTNKPLSEALVIIDGQKSRTDANGQFELGQIPVGTHFLMVVKEGYQSKTIPLSIRPNQAEKIRIALKIEDKSLPTILVKADRSASASSSLLLNALDFRFRPVQSAQDMLRNVPGLVTAQHAGGGKAEQIFLRGFDADHGTDVAAFVDDMPVNLPAHGHGQGYLDLHFLIPETVKKVAVYKGTYYADLGDFATAGAVKFQTADVLDQNIAHVEATSTPSQRALSQSRALFLYQLPLGATSRVQSYVASEFIFAPSYFDITQNFQRFNLFSKTTVALTDQSMLKVSASHFVSSWDASGQIPERAVASGQITRFGAIDPTEGGQTNRQNLIAQFSQSKNNQSIEIQGFISKYDFDLYSNFTLFNRDSINGDGIGQHDNRLIAGLNGKYVWQKKASTWSIGAGSRFDAIDNGLTFTAQRRFLAQSAQAQIQTAAHYLYLKHQWRLSEKWQMEWGVRANYLTFDVTDLIPADAQYTPYSGKNNQTQLAPKWNLAYQPNPKWRFFANIGKGFHSNDARAVVQDRGNHRLPNAWGAEWGTQWMPAPNWVVSAAFWGLSLDNELVFVGDEGTTEDNGASRRMGLDLSVRGTIARQLFLDADVNWARGRLVTQAFGPVLPTDNLIPLAPNITATGGLTWRPNGPLKGALRVRFVGDRPANEANTVVAQGYTVLDASIFYKKTRYRVGLNAENLLNTAWNEAQFDTESRLRQEPAAVSELHFTPGTPFAVKAIFSYYF